MATVAELIPGDLVTHPSGVMSGVFIARTPHPIWPHLMLVIWRVEDEGYGRWSFDALLAHQDIGDITPSTDEDRTGRLRAALLEDQSR